MSPKFHSSAVLGQKNSGPGNLLGEGEGDIKCKCEKKYSIIERKGRGMEGIYLNNFN